MDWENLGSMQLHGVGREFLNCMLLLFMSVHNTLVLRK